MRAEQPKIKEDLFSMNPDDIKSILEKLKQIKSEESAIFDNTSSMVDNDQR